MKTLSVLRHAKAERPDSVPRDFDRPLTTRGQKDAAEIGALIARLSPDVGLVISSSALRARQTTELALEAAGSEWPVIWEELVYDATAGTLLSILTQVPTDTEHLLLVGHNPGVQEFVSGLCAGEPGRPAVAMATGTLAVLNLEIFRWNQIRWGCGSLLALIKPKLLRA